ncbi:hypothetical protein [Nostoc linckia]|uniref:hypothetical protein n=1 Tax=Nostoc linckia TaxID=92942 RepID=UPI0015D511E0|nr:hypothetical protein [Nostoc linckia]
MPHWALGIGHWALGIRSVGGVGGWGRNLFPLCPHTFPCPTLFHAPCPMPHAPCPMPHAPCPISN